MSGGSIITNTAVNTRIASGDVVELFYEGGSFSNSVQMLLKRGATESNVILSETDDSQTNVLRFEALASNTRTGVLTIDFEDYVITMPPSTSPKQYTFTFWAYNGLDLYRYLEIEATLQATPAELSSDNISVTLTH